MNSKNLKNSEILELVKSLENQINTNLHELDKYQNTGKLPLYIINKKRKFLSEIQRLTSYTRFLLDSCQQPQKQHDLTPDQYYFSDIIRHSNNPREKEAARQYSISKSMAEHPELY